MPPVSRVLPVLLPLLLLAALALLLVRARREAEQRPGYLVDPRTVSVVSCPPWMPADLAQQIAQDLAARLVARLPDPASLVDGADLEAWAATLATGSPWVVSLRRVDPHFPSRAEVHLQLRRPVLVVDEEILIAADGRPLDLGRVPELQPPLLAWQDEAVPEAVAEGARAVVELAPFRAELAALGVRLAGVRTAADGTIAFVTADGVELSWGRTRAASRFAYLDLPPAERVANLRQVLADFPGLAGLSSVRLWTDKPVALRRGG